MYHYSAIGHLDADCFYVSAERVRDSFLCHKEVAVLGNQGACVIAKSYEMKARGVKTGEPIWEAIVKSPQGIYLKRDFRWYEVLSRAIRAIVTEFSPLVEYYSIDEFFFEAIPSGGKTLQETAEAIRQRIWQLIGVPVSVGIARTKTLAKLISDSAKPFGARAILNSSGERELLQSLSVKEISGIGSRRAKRLLPHGIVTSLDFALAERRLVRALLTVVGERLWWELNGTQVNPLYTQRPPHKALSRGGSLGETTACFDRIQAWLVRNIERLIEELEYHAVYAGELEVCLFHREGHIGAAKIPLMVPTARFDLLLAAGMFGIKKAWNGRGINRMHLTAMNLQKIESTQQGLFDLPSEKMNALASAKEEINKRFGRFALRSSDTLPLSEIYRDQSYQYDICDVRGKICF